MSTTPERVPPRLVGGAHVMTTEIPPWDGATPTVQLDYSPTSQPGTQPKSGSTWRAVGYFVLLSFCQGVYLGLQFSLWLAT